MAGSPTRARAAPLRRRVAVSLFDLDATCQLTPLVFLNRLIFTGGADTVVRIFETSSAADVEPRLLTEHQEDVTWMECSVSADAVLRDHRKLTQAGR